MSTPMNSLSPAKHSGQPQPSGLQRAEAEFGTIARCLQAIGHPLSLRILCLLSEGEASVGELQARLGKPLPTISLHRQPRLFHAAQPADPPPDRRYPG